MAAGDLTSTSNALAWLGDPTADLGVVARLVSAASAQIQKFLGYNVAPASYTMTFNGHGGSQVLLPQRPVTAVASVTVSGTAIIPIVGTTGYGFGFDASSVYLSGATFARGVQNCVIAYTAGFASTPLDIEQACIELVKLTYDGKDRASDLLMQRAGDTEQRFADLSASVMPRMLPPTIQALLQPYRRVTPVW